MPHADQPTRPMLSTHSSAACARRATPHLRLVHLRTILFAALAAVFLAGCASTSPEAGYPEARPLGEPLLAYRPASEAEAALGVPAETAIVPGDTLALPDVLALTLTQNPRLQAFAWEVRARDAAALQAGLYPNPTLSAETEEVSTSDPLGEFTNAEQAARLSLPLELWGRPWKQRAVAERERDLAGWDYEAARLGVLTEATQAYVGVVAAEARVRQAEEEVRLSETVYETVARQAAAGEVSPVERTRAEVPLSQARIQLRRAEEALQSAQSALAGTMGLAQAPPFAVRRDTLAAASPVPDLAALRPLAQQNPLVARQEDEIARAEAALSLEKAGRFPVPQLTAGAQRFGATDTEAFAAGIALPLPLFDRNQGAVARARADLERTRRERQSARVQLDTALTRAYRDLVASQNEAQTLTEETLPAARRAFEAVRQGYRQGKFGFLEVLDAQSTLFAVRRQQIQALAAYYQQRAAVERLIAAPLDTAE